MARKYSKNFLHHSSAKGLCSLCSRGKWVGKYSRTYKHHKALLVERSNRRVDWRS